jgi:hypothetical protein
LRGTRSLAGDQELAEIVAASGKEK